MHAKNIIVSTTFEASRLNRKIVSNHALCREKTCAASIDEQMRQVQSESEVFFPRNISFISLVHAGHADLLQHGSYSIYRFRHAR